MSSSEPPTQGSFGIEQKTPEKYVPTNGSEGSSKLYIWINGQGRRYCRIGQDHEQEFALCHLTAVAQHGFEAVAEADCIHHRMELFIGSRESLEPLSWSEHSAHHSNDVNGFESPGDVFDRWSDECDAAQDDGG